MIEMDDLSKLLKRLRLLPEEGSWLLQPSQIGGQGIFARRNIKCGETIFIDSPIVTGPRSIQQLAACVACYRQDRPLEPCNNGCHLPLCGDCQVLLKERNGHATECEILKKLEPLGDSWSWTLFWSLITIRSLFMSELERSVVRKMHAIKGEGVDLQVRNLIKSVKKQFSSEQIAWMTHCTGVIDGTSFEVEKTPLDGARYASLKGLYPLAGLMNHSCRPNTRHHFVDNDGTLLVVACRDIKMSEEVTVSYCPLLWPLYVRRLFLLKTKVFYCTCIRCREPTEFDELLAGIYCSHCPNGIIQPSKSSAWSCQTCSATIPRKNMIPLILKLLNNKPDLPGSNYIRIHDKLLAIWSTKKENLSGTHLDNVKVKRIVWLIRDCSKLCRTTIWMVLEAL